MQPSINSTNYENFNFSNSQNIIFICWFIAFGVISVTLTRTCLTDQSTYAYCLNKSVFLVTKVTEVILFILINQPNKDFGLIDFFAVYFIASIFPQVLLNFGVTSIIVTTLVEMFESKHEHLMLHEIASGKYNNLKWMIWWVTVVSLIMVNMFAIFGPQLFSVGDEVRVIRILTLLSVYLLLETAYRRTRFTPALDVSDMNLALRILLAVTIVILSIFFVLISIDLISTAFYFLLFTISPISISLSVLYTICEEILSNSTFVHNSLATERGASMIRNGLENRIKAPQYVSNAWYWASS